MEDLRKYETIENAVDFLYDNDEEFAKAYDLVNKNIKNKTHYSLDRIIELFDEMKQNRK